jgi:HK97 family phage major capsid protein/HK97 family phage prohead protease
MQTLSIEQRDRPQPPEQRTVDVNVEALEQRGRTLHGYAAVYGAESGDLGGFRERIAAGAFANVLEGDVRCLLNHDPNVVLGRTTSGTLRLFDEQRGLRFEVDLPESRSDIREAVSRGDIDGASFRFKVGEESWDGEMRTVKTIAELHDVTVATYGAYPEASVELRTRPEGAGQGQERPPVLVRRGLRVEDRTGEPVGIEQRVAEALRAVAPGETRSLTTTSADPIAPPELSAFLFDRLRASSVALASGIRVVPTDRESIEWPKITADVDPAWYAETDTITPGDPAFATITATPRKLAHLVELSNEVIDDSEPAIVDVLNGHLAAVLGLKLDLAIFEGNQAVNPNVIRGLKYTPGIQTVDQGLNGAAFSYDAFLKAIGLLLAANVPGPYVAVLHPRTATDAARLKDADGNQLTPPVGMPPVSTTTQLSVTETKGTSSNASSAYVYAPAQLVVVRRQDASIELDRSRLFNRDMSELRGRLRADLVVPNPAAVVRIEGITPAAA